MTSTPSTRRELDGVALWSITGRASQHSRVLAEKGLSEESSVHPTLTLLDCAQVLTDLENGATLRAFLSRRLRCSAMRISKKFAGDKCLGKQTYLRRTASAAEVEAEARTLEALEARAFTAPEAASVPAALPAVAETRPEFDAAAQPASLDADVLMTDARKPVPDCPDEMWDCDYIPNQDVDSVEQLLRVVAQHDGNNSFLEDTDLPEDPALWRAVAESLSPSPPAAAAKYSDLREGLELLWEKAEKGDGASQVMLDAILSNTAMLRDEGAEEEEKRESPPSNLATADEVSELLRQL